MTVEETFNSLLAQTGMEEDSTKAVAALLELPDDKFKVIAPGIMSSFEKELNTANDKLIIAQAMHATGAKLEDIGELIDTLNKEIDNLNYSQIKKDFIKGMCNSMYNALAAVEGIAKRTIKMPIELCKEDAKIPCYANLTDAGADIYAPEEITLKPGEQTIIWTGIKIACPPGYAVLIHPRSGMSSKTKMRICNSIGLIDSGYRGEIGVIVENICPKVKDISSHYEDDKLVIDSILYGDDLVIDKGQRFAQMRLVEVPKIAFYKVDNVQDFDGDRKSGFGGTGK